MRLLAAVCVAFMWPLAPPLHTAVISISVSEWGDFAFDLDDDGIPEIQGGSFSDSGAGFLITLDAVDSDYRATFPDGEESVGIAGGRFSSFDELRAAPIWSGDLQMGDSTSRMYDNLTGFGGVTPEEPVYAMWQFGTFGEGNAPFSLVGYVFDFSYAFATGGTEDILFAYHHYGYVEAGDFVPDLSLAATGIPEPRYAAWLFSVCALAAAVFFRRRNSVRA